MLNPKHKILSVTGFIKRQSDLIIGDLIFHVCNSGRSDVNQIVIFFDSYSNQVSNYMDHILIYINQSLNRLPS